MGLLGWTWPGHEPHRAFIPVVIRGGIATVGPTATSDDLSRGRDRATPLGEGLSHPRELVEGYVGAWPVHLHDLPCVAGGFARRPCRIPSAFSLSSQPLSPDENPFLARYPLCAD